MPIYKVSTAREKYKTIAKKSSNIYQLTGRRSANETAARVKMVIENLNSIDIKSKNLFIDVGCGDGSFLEKIAPNFKCSIGILPSSEECLRVSEALGSDEKIRIELGTTEDLTNSNLPTKADLILCNSVLHGVGFRLENVENSFNNFSNYQKSGQILYIGEMPVNNEMEDRNYDLSFKKYILWCIKNKMYTRLFYNLSLYLKACFTDYIYIIQGTNMFYCLPNRFNDIGSKNGYKLVAVHNSFTNESVKLDNIPAIGRFDYIFKRI